MNLFLCMCGKVILHLPWPLRGEELLRPRCLQKVDSRWLTLLSGEETVHLLSSLRRGSTWTCDNMPSRSAICLFTTAASSRSIPSGLECALQGALPRTTSLAAPPSITSQFLKPTPLHSLQASIKSLNGFLSHVTKLLILPSPFSQKRMQLIVQQIK